jgi:hypothetical protein
MGMDSFVLDFTEIFTLKQALFAPIQASSHSFYQD